MDNTYSPKNFEDEIYQFWVEHGYFKASPDETKKPYTIVIPPPNVTGVLHMGHGLNNTIQDTLIRWKRMQGYEALWIPGTDHAGIATQNVVEKKIKKEYNKSRDDVGREAFIQEVWKWKETHGNTIIKQLKKLGASCDWDRERFTMDEGLSNAVKEVFLSLYEKGLIYKGKYIINWCPRCGTALADEEAEHKDIDGFFYHIKYPIKDSNEFVIIATTRPETMLGDTAVAINPTDERYSHLKGKTLILPLVNSEIPIIEDEFVDKEFGTGCVKVTPAHDPNDFEMGIRHHLKRINIFTLDGKMNDAVPEQYRGMDRFECRKAVIKDLENKGLFIKKVPHQHSVGHCYRCNTVVEPYLSEQWFVKMQPLAKPAIDAVENGEITFYPERWKKVYLNWMNNIRDWCISRQIWWGHRIPIWYCEHCGEVIPSKETPEKCPQCQSTHLHQDSDVLDTWFSSWLWPFSTLGWPEKNKELDFFYPTDTLVTDPGIIFFWVARMIMSGLEFMKQIPFKDVYIHGVILDDKGRKMSKSLGNGIDPLEVVEEFGADALRYTILSITAQGQNVLLSMDKFSIGKFFANKIWNASKYILSNYETIKPSNLDLPDESILNLPDKWILTLVEELKEHITELLEKFRFNDVALAIHDFFWHQFCDWYLEISKVDLYSDNINNQEKGMQILMYVLKEALKILHPIMPFITEELWQNLPEHSESIMKESWPEKNKKLIFEKDRKTFEFIKKVVYSIRNIRGEMNIPPKKEIHILIKTKSIEKQNVIKNYEMYIQFLSKTASMEVGANLTKPDDASSAAVDSETEIFIPLKGNVDLEKERLRLEKEIAKLDKDIAKLDSKLNNKNFVEKAPADIVAKVKEEYGALQKQRTFLTKNLKEV